MVAKEKVVQVCAGNSYTLILTHKGKIYSMGNNVSGQLGLNVNMGRNVPSYIDSKYFNHEKIIQISCGWDHSIALSKNGNVYSWGYGHHGELGHGDQLTINVPTKIDSCCFNHEPVKMIATGVFVSIASTVNNNIYIWGERSGSYCFGDNSGHLEPTLIDPNTYNKETIVKLSCKRSHILLLTKNQNSTKLYSLGFNMYGALGLGHKKKVNTFQLIDSNYFENQKIIDIESGHHFSLALVEDEDLKKTNIYAWGFNIFCSLGLDDPSNRTVPCKIDPSFFDGRIVSIGTSNHKSFAITKKHNSKKTKIYTWGRNQNQEIKEGYSHPNIMEIDCLDREEIMFIGGNHIWCIHSFAISQTGKLFIWGNNQFGQLGLGNNDNFDTPQPCCPHLFGSLNNNQKMYNNQSFEDLKIEFQ